MLERIKLSDLRKLLKKRGCPECEMLIREEGCGSCTCYMTASCPFFGGGEPWFVNEPYEIVEDEE